MIVDGAHWYRVTQRDPRAVGLYLRHYSSKRGGRDVGRLLASGIAAPGEKLVLLTAACDALFVWQRSTIPRDDGQAGVNCAVFRNEGAVLSSELIRDADTLAWARWPGEARHFTYVDATEVRRKRDPGRCFVRAGWRRLVERSRDRALVILERTLDTRTVSML